MLLKDKVSVVFGCWTSVSRKSVLPVFEHNNGLLFYPVQYEGEELSKNIFYTAEAVNQQAIPLWITCSRKAKRNFYLLGSDYVYPRTTNKILKKYLKLKGVPDADIIEIYTPFGHTDLPDHRGGNQKICGQRQRHRDQHAERRHQHSVLQGIRQRRFDLGKLPVVSFSISEDEFRGLPAKQLVGQLGLLDLLHVLEDS